MTETSTEVAVRTGGALAVGAEQTAWTEQQLAVLRSVGVSEDVTAAELTAFLHESQRTGLDPFSRQIYLIGRKDKKAGREVFRSQTGIDGYRVVAHRAARRDGVSLSYADTVWCGPDGVWREVWLWEKPPLAAKVTVYRDGQPFPAVATLGEYAARYPSGDLYPMWAKMPATMLAKCAEACALRKAFPFDLAGIYTAEEMDQADARQPQTQVAEAVVRKAQRERSGAEDPWVDHGVALPDDEPRPSTQGQRTKLTLLCRDKYGAIDRDAVLAVLSLVVGRPIRSRSDLSFAEAHQAIEKLSAQPDHVPDAEPVAAPNPRNGDVPVAAGVEAALATPDAAAAAALVAASDQLAADWMAAISGAPTHGELDSIGRKISAAVQGGQMLEADRKTLEEAWRDRKKQLPPQEQSPQDEDGDGWSHRMVAERTGAPA